MDIFAIAGQRDRVEQLYNRVPPRTETATILIKAFGRDNLPERATAFLKENMLRKYDKSTNASALLPDIHTFTAVINCWVRANSVRSCK